MSNDRQRGPRRRRRRGGLGWEPYDGWPLDRLLVGPGTVRTIRQLFHEDRPHAPGAYRAWDLALCSGVSPQGTADALDRLWMAGLVERVCPRRSGDAASFRIDWEHPLTEALARLFWFEEAAFRRRPRGLRR